MLVLRTFPELVGRSVQNLVEIGPAVRALKGYLGTYSHFYIYRYRYEEGFGVWLARGGSNQYLLECRVEIDVFVFQDGGKGTLLMVLMAKSVNEKRICFGS